MNGRIHGDGSPEGRIAAVAKSLCLQMEAKHRKTGVGPKAPDYADFRDILRPFLQREILNARIDEARKLGGKIMTERVRQLAIELQELKFPDEYDL